MTNKKTGAAPRAHLVREHSIIEAIKRHLRKYGWICWKNHGSGYTEVGLPDIMAFRNGVFMAIEAKRPGNKPTDMQLHWIERYKNQGAIAFVAYGVADVERELVAAGLSGPIED